MASVNKTLQFGSNLTLISKNNELYVAPVPIQGDTFDEAIKNLAKNHGDGIYIIRFQKPDGKEVERRVKVDGHDMLNMPRQRKKKIKENPESSMQPINNQSENQMFNEAFRTFGEALKSSMERERDLNDKLLTILASNRSQQPNTVQDMQQVYEFQKKVKNDALEGYEHKENPSLAQQFTVDHGIKLIDMFMNRLDKRQQTTPVITQNQQFDNGKIKRLEDTVNRLSLVVNNLVDKVIPNADNTKQVQ